MLTIGQLRESIKDLQDDQVVIFEVIGSDESWSIDQIEQRHSFFILQSRDVTGTPQVV